MRARSHLWLFLPLIARFLFADTGLAQQPSDQQEVRGAPAEPTDAAETRDQIAMIEKLMPNFPDRGAALYLLAAAHQHLGESREALQLLKECLALGEGFDPSGGPE